MSLTDDERDTPVFQEIGENNFKQLKNKASKLGYADGVNVGRESVFQKGFDQGYKDGICTSFELNKYKHFFKNLNIEKVNDEALHKEKLEYDELEINESDPQLHLKHLDDNLDLVSRKQQEYVEESKKYWARKFPKATDLLKAPSST